MRDHKRTGLTLTIIGVLSLLIGCGSKTQTVTFEMEPYNTASATLEGDRPFVMVQNKGPGPVQLRFNRGVGFRNEARTLTPGTASGCTVYGPKQVTVETGPENGAIVEVESQNASGMAVSGPVPK
jgi:hypothetical protein